MAATFVVETGTGSATANSYGAVADADQYHENYGDPAAWSALTDALKQLHLREATRYIDATFGTQWIGVRLEKTQRLDWPQSGATDLDGYAVDSDSVPVVVQEACFVLALADVTDTLIADLSAPSGSIIREKTKVGEIEIDTAFSGGSTTQKTYTLARRILQPVLGGSGVVYRA
jgi:hypothetical protein